MGHVDKGLVGRRRVLVGARVMRDVMLRATRVGESHGVPYVEHGRRDSGMKIGVGEPASRGVLGGRASEMRDRRGDPIIGSVYSETVSNVKVNRVTSSRGSDCAPRCPN